MPTPQPSPDAPPAGPPAVRELLPMFLDPAVVSAVWERFCVPLHTIAARHLGPRVRGRVDPEDVVQSVYRTLYRRAKSAAAEAACPPQPAPAAPDDPGLLWKLLVTITIRKAINKRVAQLRRKRSVAATVSGDGPDWEGAAAEPTPAELVEQAESLAALKAALVDAFTHASHRRIAALVLEGRGAKEIAAEVGCVERTVYRVKSEMEESAVGWLGETESGEAP